MLVAHVTRRSCYALVSITVVCLSRTPVVYTNSIQCISLLYDGNDDDNLSLLSHTGHVIRGVFGQHVVTGLKRQITCSSDKIVPILILFLLKGVRLLFCNKKRKSLFHHSDRVVITHRGCSEIIFYDVPKWHLFLL